MNMILKSLQKMHPNKELLMISFFITNSEGLRKIESHWAKRDPDHSRILGRCKRDTEAIKIEELGGSIVLMDPDNFNQGFLAEIGIPVATGMFYDKTTQNLLVGSYSCIKKVFGGQIIDSFSHPLFNDIHTITNSFEGNLLVVSSGVDAILEIDIQNPKKIIWNWLATEHGYNSTPDGRSRKINKNRDYRKISSATLDHSTHINSCLSFKRGKILATLFHQGALVEIDKKSGKVNTLLAGLRAPHHVRKWNKGFMVSDTLNKRVLFLDSKYKVVKETKGDFNWVQDALQFTKGVIIGDSNNGRLVKTDINGRILEEFKWDKKKRKMSSFLKIKLKDATNIFKEIN